MTSFRTFALSLGLVTALGTGGAMAGAADNSITIGMGEDLPSLDGYINTSRDSIVFNQHVHDMLVYRNPKTFEYEPLLATEWKMVDDLNWEFKLREGVTFHDGSAFTAEDVAFTLNYWAKPESGARSQGAVSWIERVEAVDDHTVVIQTKRPFPAALEFLSGSLPIYPSDYFEKVGADAFGQNPVGAGPYKYEGMSAGTIKLVAFDAYHGGGGKATPSIKTIDWRIIPDIATRIAEVMGGGVDWIWNVPSDQVEQMKAVPTLHVELSGTMRFGYMHLDAAGRTGEGNPLTDVRVRRAMNHAIDRQAIVDNLVGERGEIVSTPCFPAQFGCDTSAAVVYNYDPEKAKALLTEAGYADGFTVAMRSYRDRDRAEAVQGYLGAVGINVELEMIQPTPGFNSWREGRLPIWYGDWGSFSMADASASMGVMFDGSNNDGARDATVMALVTEAGSLMDPEARKAKYSEAIKIITEQAYWVPLHTILMGYAYSADLIYEPTLDEIPRFFDASWK